jgi:flagellar biosynthetic protein FliR
MINITQAQLMGWLTEWFWPFVRIGACLMVAPLFGARFVPARIRIALAAAIGFLVAPLLPSPPAVSLFSGEGIVILLQQILIGVAVGFVLQVVFDAIGLAGQVLANSMGLSFAFNIDPLRGTSTVAVGQFYLILMTLTFITLDGHLAIIELIVQGFQTLPVGAVGLGADGLWRVASSGAVLFSGALQVALPGITALMVANIAFGLISRAAPTLNIFSVGFALSIVFGLIVLQVGLPGIQQGFIELTRSAFDDVAELQQPSAR